MVKLSHARTLQNAPFWKDQSQPVKESRRSGGHPRLWCDDCTCAYADFDRRGAAVAGDYPPRMVPDGGKVLAADRQDVPGMSPVCPRVYKCVLGTGKALSGAAFGDC